MMNMKALGEKFANTSDEVRPISLNDLAALTLRANVAFAVRCAHRIKPCLVLPADAPRRGEQMRAVDKAIEVATAFCRGEPGETGRAAAAALAAGVVAEDTYESTRFAAYAAVRAAEAAAAGEEAARNPNQSSVMEAVAGAFGAARVLAANVDNYALDMVVRALRADVDMLLDPAVGTCQDLGAPVDPAESGPLGPLWPAGRPICFAPRAG